MDTLKSSILEDLERWSQAKTHIACLKQLSSIKPPGCKEVNLSNIAREEGNKLFATCHFNSKLQHKTLQQYNEGIAYAPVGSEEMAKAYANKSALLLLMRKYKESIAEADRALAITKLISVKVKLFCRKAECLTALGSSENRSCLEKARFALHKSEDAVAKESLMKFIEKAQSVVDAEKLDTPKEIKRKIEVSKVIADEERKNIWDSVGIKCSPKYGRHIVAARDFWPGDIILVEKPYLYHLMESRTYQYCYKCFNYLWTVAPCDHCCWRMFCSEECKKGAWEEYHDEECSVISKMKFVFGWQWDANIPLLLSVFLKAFRQAGSIDELETGFRLSKHEDQCSNNLDYRTILASPTLFFTQEELKAYSNCSVIVLIGLAKFTTIFKKSYDFDEIGKLMRNDKAIFIGCLLLKFSTIIGTGAATARLVNPAVQDGSFQEMKTTTDAVEKEESMNPVINIMTMMTLVGCIPNVETCRTIEHKSVMFALQPIKAGTPLMAYNKSPSFYHSTPKSERQLIHQQHYNCSCDCQACTENWPVRSGESSEESFRMISIPPGSNSHALKRIASEIESISAQLNSLVFAHKPNYPDIKAVARVKNLATEAWQHFVLPSPALFYCTNLMASIMRSFHNPDKNLFTSPGE